MAQAQRALGNRATPCAVTVRTSLEAATINGAACLGLADQIGTLTPGKQADIIAIRTDGIAVYPSHNAIGTVVHMIDRADVAEVMVAGALRKHAGRCWTWTWRDYAPRRMWRERGCSTRLATRQTRTRAIPSTSRCP